jgi:hypothetical protein
MAFGDIKWHRHSNKMVQSNPKIDEVNIASYLRLRIKFPAESTPFSSTIPLKVLLRGLVKISICPIVL